MAQASSRLSPFVYLSYSAVCIFTFAVSINFSHFRSLSLLANELITNDIMFIFFFSFDLLCDEVKHQQKL